MGYVEYLGHSISKDDIKPRIRLIEAVINAPRLSNKDETRLFLGLAEYMATFVQNISDLTDQLRVLLKKTCTPTGMILVS